MDMGKVEAKASKNNKHSAKSMNVQGRTLDEGCWMEDTDKLERKDGRRTLDGGR